jgi:hypothetical protein
MKYTRKMAVLMTFLLLCINCSDDNTMEPESEYDEGSWWIYSPLRWTHDGEPMAGQYCKVYTDAASESLKRQCIEFADRMFGEIMQLFQVNELYQMILPKENDRINVYINTSHEENIAYAYWGTIFITVRSQVLNEKLYEYLFKHELTHEFEFLVEGKVNLGTPVWFRESIAIYCGGGFNRINTEADLDRWITENKGLPGQGNPILIRDWSDFPDGADIDRYYWYGFDIVMRYLLDPLGQRDNFGIETETFEQEFYCMIRGYLNRINIPSPSGVSPGFTIGSSSGTWGGL